MTISYSMGDSVFVALVTMCTIILRFINYEFRQQTLYLRSIQFLQ
jgi:hypothetical protein